MTTESQFNESGQSPGPAEAKDAHSAPCSATAPVGPSGLAASMVCQHCLKPITVLLPCEPIYSLQDAAFLLLTNKAALVSLMGKHKAQLDPPLYRTVQHRRMRYLSANDIRTLRSILYSTRRFKKLLAP